MKPASKSLEKERGKTVYAFIYNWPETGNLTLTAPKMSAGSSTVSLVGYDGDHFRFKPRQGRGVDIAVPAIPISRLPNLWLWGLKLTGVEN